MTLFTSRNRALLLSSCILAMAGFMVGVQALAIHALPLLSPAVVATVDLETTINSLDEWAEMLASETDIGDGLQSEVKRRQDEIELLEADLEDYPSGSEKFKEAFKRYQMASIELQGYVQFQQLKSQQRTSELILKLYEKIKLIAKQLADENGYDIILMNDSVLEIPENPENIVREISNRRILFARTQMDITDQLIQRMNADHQASADSK
ncbi:MAG: OmpH family outer membrane protein [Planctomycetota bacterium]|nr:OmpH family outer membrane protein [Planctomycetota bacterium]